MAQASKPSCSVTVNTSQPCVCSNVRKPGQTVATCKIPSGPWKESPLAVLPVSPALEMDIGVLWPSRLWRGGRNWVLCLWLGLPDRTERERAVREGPSRASEFPAAWCLFYLHHKMRPEYSVGRSVEVMLVLDYMDLSGGCCLSFWILHLIYMVPHISSDSPLSQSMELPDP